MTVRGLNHVNIVARDLDRTVAFYRSVLGMRADPIPNVPSGFAGRWIYDEADHPAIHVQAYNPDRHGQPLAEGTKTGAIDHVALTCVDMAGLVRRCEELGIDHRVNDGRYGLKQVFVTDPDGVVLELNFPEG